MYISEIKNFEKAFISAERKKITDVIERKHTWLGDNNEWTIDTQLNSKDNEYRNKILNGFLLGYGFTIFESVPFSVCNAKFPKGFLVINNTQDIHFLAKILAISEYMNQDKILYCNNDLSSNFIEGTNNNSDFKYHVKNTITNCITEEFINRKIIGHSENICDLTPRARYGLRCIMKKKIQEINVLIQDNI